MVVNEHKANYKGTYPPSALGNFKVVDTIAYPHPYMIMPGHLKHCSSMCLDIEEAERHGAKCGICKRLVKQCKQPRVLTYKEHEQALVIECRVNIKDEHGNAIPEPSDYLHSIKVEAEKNGYIGFAFYERGASNGK